MDRLQSMRVFQKVVDEGGFALAARALDLSPAAVTRFIGDLERHLGTRLLQRTTRRLALTEAGDDYLSRVRTILRELDAAESAAAAHTRELHGVLHIVTTPVLASYFLAPRVASWSRRHPAVVLDIAADASPLSRMEEFDLSIMVVDEGFDANVVARPLMRGDWILCASPAYLERAGTPGTPQDLRQHQYLRFQRPQASQASHTARRLRLTPAAGGDTVEIDMPVVLQSQHSDLLHRAALDGAGIAVLSRVLATPQIEAGQLVHLLPAWVSGRYTLYGALPARQLVPARTQAFLEFLREPFAPPRMAI